MRRDGLWTWLREGGGLLQVGRFKDGEQHGSWKRFRVDGAPYDGGRYVAGRKTGVWKTYDARGRVKRTKDHRAAR